MSFMESCKALTAVSLLTLAVALPAHAQDTAAPADPAAADTAAAPATDAAADPQAAADAAAAPADAAPAPVEDAGTAPDGNKMAEVDNPYGLSALWAQGDFVARGVLIIMLIMSASTWY
ncbi:MotA/TolQ/ExbB proton channel family protein, partial [Solimonas sp. C16B3]|nr:MotA/TolQ/ExbB proton channel family protein [Solimonas marina]